MRILHTADLHIGQTLNGWTRDVEHRAFLETLPELVESKKIDALVVAGDVFDNINPSAESMQLLYDALIALKDRRPHLTTVIVAGNHDPAGRLEAPASLLRKIGVHVSGVIHRSNGRINMDRHLIPLRDIKGEVRAHVLAVPFLRAADLPGLGQDGDGVDSPVVRATRILYAEAIAEARSRVGAAPLVVTGHLHCSGCLESAGAERRILVGGEHAVPHDIFPDDLAYVALGHLHRSQNVGRTNIRYSGSPFPLSATELSYEHGISLVELHPDGTSCDHIRIARPVPCLRIPREGALSISALDSTITTLGLDADCPREQQPFVHVVISPDASSAGLVAEVDRILDQHPVRCAGVKIERPARPANGDEAAPVAVRLSECDPAELFELAFDATHGMKPGPDHRAAFHQAETVD
jgi:exonuclease SbcD